MQNSIQKGAAEIRPALDHKGEATRGEQVHADVGMVHDKQAPRGTVGDSRDPGMQPYLFIHSLYLLHAAKGMGTA
jgi:hypothetical protein